MFLSTLCRCFVAFEICLDPSLFNLIRFCFPCMRIYPCLDPLLCNLVRFSFTSMHICTSVESRARREVRDLGGEIMTDTDVQENYDSHARELANAENPRYRQRHRRI